LLPSELKDLPRWVLWKLEPGKDGRLTKVPYNPHSGGRASSTDSTSWSTFDRVERIYQTSNCSGIGFILTNKDDIVCVDLDDKEGTEDRLPEFKEIASKFNSFTEVSFSGRGIHIWCRGKKPGNRCRKGDLEIYDGGRFIAVTGNMVEGSPSSLNNAQSAIDAFYERIVTPEAQRTPSDIPPLLSDEEIINLAHKHSRGFSSLWHGDFSRYPSQSEADAALCLLVSWYSKDIFQIDRIFRQSGLYREKWERGDYRIRTIESAIKKQTGQYDPNYGGSTRSNSQPEFKKVGKPSIETGSLTLTDLGNAERFKRLFGNDVCYCPELKKWFIWNGKRWEYDSTQKRELCVIDVVRGIYGEAESEPDETQRKKIAAWATASESHQKRTAMLQTVSSLLAIRHDELDAKPDLFNLQNGSYNLVTHEFREHRQEDRLTKMGGVNYDPSAKCPTWEKHLNLIFNQDEELISGFQALCGYSLLSGNPAEIFVVAWGSGRNGKGKTFDAITHIFGDYSGNTSFSTFVASKYSGGRGSASPELIDLIGTRFVRASESEEGARLAEAMIKSLTGGDLISARGLYQGFITFKPEFTIFLQTNHKPVIRNWDQAIEARLWLVPFDKYIEQEDRDYQILEKLVAEGSGILNWMLEGLKRFQDKGRLVQPKRVKQATEEYKQEQDRLSEFVNSLCEKGDDLVCFRKDLYLVYQQDCYKNGIEPIGQNIFSKLLMTNHRVKEGPRQKDGRTWKGICPKKIGDSCDTYNYKPPSDNRQKSLCENMSPVSPAKENQSQPMGKTGILVDSSDTSDTSDTISRKLITRGGDKESLDNSCHRVTNLPSWLDHHQATGLPDPSKYKIVDKPGASKCRCKGCNSPPLMSMNGMYHLCQMHFKEYRELWEKEHPEVKE